MANTLKKIFVPNLDQVAQTYTIESWHVSQSVDAFTGAEAYDITLSGSLVVTGSVAINGLSNVLQGDILTYNSNTGLISYTASSAFNVNNFYTSSVTQSITSSVVNNNINSSTINQTIISSSVNSPAPANKYVQYNSGSTFGASIGFQYDYTIESLSQGNNCSLGPSATYAHVEGTNTVALQPGAHAEGGATLAFGIASHAEGYNTTSSGAYSHTEGGNTTATGDYAHTEGENTTAAGDSSHAEGYNTIAIGYASHAEGRQTTSTGDSSHAEGQNTNAIGEYSHAEGVSTIASGTGSHASGLQNSSSGNYSFTAGLQNKATNTYTFAAGLQNMVSGNGAAAFGYLNHVDGQMAFSIGNSNSASGQYSFASGLNTKAQGVASFTAGYFTSASGDYQTVVGILNEFSTSPYAFIVGGGTGASKKTLLFASGSQFQLSGSFAPQYRNVGSINTGSFGNGILLTSRDYNVTFTATTSPALTKNEIILLSSVPKGTVVYLQRTSGIAPVSTISVKASSGNINGAVSYTFPTTLYARRMFVFDGTNWFTEPNPIA
jgi:hypothetical protein